MIQESVSQDRFIKKSGLVGIEIFFKPFKVLLGNFSSLTTIHFHETLCQSRNLQLIISWEFITQKCQYEDTSNIFLMKISSVIMLIMLMLML